MSSAMESGALQASAVAGFSGAGITVPDANLLFLGDYSRSGHDLVLTGSDGAKLVLDDYFITDTPPSLISPEGAMLTGDVVTVLAGPLFPGQYAQAGGALNAKPAIGKVESSSGSASVVRADGTTETLKAGDPVFQGDVVLTGPGSKLGISFIDGTLFSLSANARMVLNSLVYDPDGSNNSMLFSLVEGTFVFATGEIAPTGDMKIQTPVATMGIRGTTPTVEIVSGATQGGVNFSIINNQDGTVGSYTLYSLVTGQPIGTVSNIGTMWQLTSATGQIVEIDKTEADLENDFESISLINQLFSQWESSTTQGPQAGPDNPPGSGGLNTNPPNPGTTGGEGGNGATGGDGGTGGGEQQNGPPTGNTPPPPPANTNTNNEPPPVNQPPIADDDIATTDENNSITINVLANDTDPDGATAGLTVASVDGTNIMGAVTINPDGTITYDPNSAFDFLNPGETAQETFSYVLQDPQGQTDTGEVTVTVTGTVNVINGDDNPNILNGTPFDDEINALGGNDFIFAGPTAFNVNQGRGVDVYNGGEGTDTLLYDQTTQGVTIDLANGTASGPEIDNDTFTSIEKFIGGDGDDTFIVTQDGDWFFNGGAGIDTVRIAGDLDIDTENFQGDAANIEIIDLNKTHDNTITISLDDNETLQFRGGPGDTLNLTSDLYDANDQMVEGGWRLADQPVTISGLTFAVYEFFDVLDNIRATAHAELGIAVVLVDQTITGTEGDDNTANGTALNGTPGDDIINALGGNDEIHAGAGNDTVNAGAGNDTIIGGSGEGDDTYNGGEDEDTLSYISTSDGVTIDLTNGTASGPEIGNDTFTGIERFVGGGGADTLIVGADSPVFFDGAGGTDTVLFSGDLNIDTATTQIDAANIEIIDLNKTHDNTLTISAEDVQNEDGQPLLQIRGGPGDTLNLTSEFHFDYGGPPPLLLEGLDAIAPGFGAGAGFVVEGKWEMTGGTFEAPDGLILDVYQFVGASSQVLATVHVEPGINVVLGQTIVGKVTGIEGPVNVGYYDASDEQGDPSQAAPIQAAGHNAINITAPNAAALQGLSVLFLQVQSNSSYGAEFLNNLAAIHEAVAAGMTLIIHDRFVSNAETILPGSEGFNIVRSFVDDANIDVLDPNSTVTDGPGGIVTDSTLDGGTSSTHGFAVEGTLPPGSELILSTGNATHIVTFSYEFGEGNVIYSTIPLDFYLNGSGPPGVSSNFRDIYAPNVVEYGAELSLDQDLTLTGGPGNDIIIGGPGNDTITGGPGNDTFVFGSLLDGIDLITDFGSQDTLDLTGLLNGVFDLANVSGTVQATTIGNDTTISVDVDGPGPGGPEPFTDIAVLQGVGEGVGIAVSIGDDDTTVTSAVVV